MTANSNYVAELRFGPRTVDEDAFVAPTAVVVGAVTTGARASIWYGAIARADQEVIVIGPDSNVQDGCSLHSDPGSPLLGTGSIVMNGAHIGTGSIVAAGAVVTPTCTVPPRSVVAGVPATVVRQGTDDDLAHIRAAAESYTVRLPAARKVRPVLRRPLPPAGTSFGDGMP